MSRSGLLALLDRPARTFMETRAALLVATPLEVSQYNTVRALDELTGNLSYERWCSAPLIGGRIGLTGPEVEKDLRDLETLQKVRSKRVSITDSFTGARHTTVMWRLS